MNDFPKINSFYWLLLISANTLGETAGDLISQSLHLGYDGGTILLITLFVAAIAVCIFSKRNQVFMYWIAMTLASTAGTTISDYLTRSLFKDILHYSEKQAYVLGSVFLLVVMVLLFIGWKLYFRSITFEKRFTKSAKFLYWTMILTSSTLGTSVGDFLAHDTFLGFGGATLFLLAFILIVILLVYFTKVSRQLCYWSAIIFTHPIGATMGDYLTKEKGFNLGNSKASFLLLCIIISIVLIHLLIKKRNDLQEKK